ncbi:hypothetical protein LOK49_LG08G02117 [Camellia lanceoleosa]|uniref:Uncharacterized protein n=1 Tax=Camellia lanceoleosa TaxID=1840588 RepID=A0ACC0GXL0_9ERIC|nr:hypothetical protein LOK49_LG08G02117 [Camellia lanceoleosa]
MNELGFVFGEERLDFVDDLGTSGGKTQEKESGVIVEPAPPTNNAFGSTQISSQTTSVFETNNSPFGSSGSFGGQIRNQSFGSSFASNAASFSNSAVSAERNPFFTSAVSPQVPSSASFQSSIVPNGPNSASTAVEQLSVNVDTIFQKKHLRTNIYSRVILELGMQMVEI